MAYNLEEQEQLENLKAFWNQRGTLIVTVLVVAALAVSGWRAWGWYGNRQAGQAAVVYEQLRTAASEHDVARVRETAGRLFGDYSSTAYAQMAALVAARAYVDAGDAKAAKVALEWAVSNAEDEEFRHAARLRLASILLDEGSYDEGLKLLEVPAPGHFAALYADRRGDLLVARKEGAKARAAYDEALEALPSSSPLRRLVQLKRDAIASSQS